MGIVFPVHGWRVPRFVRKFIDRLFQDQTDAWLRQVPHVWAVATAGDSIGRTMERLRTQLAGGGWHLDYCASLILPESYVGLPGMDVDTPEKESSKKLAAEAQIETIAHDITQLTEADKTVAFPKGWKTLKRGPIPSFFSGPVGGFFERYLITDRHFHVKEDDCIHCGRCGKVCPVDNIRIHNGLPVWLHKQDCLTCFSCYHHCPRHAIEFGSMPKKKGQYYYSKNQ